MTLFKSIIDFILPKQCVCCESLGAYVCKDCLERVSQVDHELCQSCQKTRRGEVSICVDCQKSIRGIENYWSLYCYEGLIAELIQRYKFDDEIWVAEFFAEQLVKRFTDQIKLFDVVISVPLSSERLRERGFNQSHLLSKMIASRIGSVRLPKRVLGRYHRENSQVQLNREQRLQNLKNCFFVQDPRSIVGKRCLILDDVKTTGATLKSCADVLKSAGALSVSAMTVAVVKYRS